MALKVVGAGLGRTGTTSLKAALERLLGEPCYHMIEVFGHPEHTQIWKAAAEGEDVDWDALFEGYAAAVDWPVGSFWPEVSAKYPDAPVILSTRTDAETWWRSAEATIFAGLQGIERSTEGDSFVDMWEAIATHRFTSRWREREPAMEAYEAHNAAVRAGVPAERLIEWQPGDGWEPLCQALQLPVPDEPFPHLNTTEDWQQRHDDSTEPAS
jgi:hypothetical protein